MNKLSWYVSRLKTMSVPEFAFRAGQNFQKQLEKRNILKIDHSKQDYKSLIGKLVEKQYAEVPANLGEAFVNYNKFEFFGMSVPLAATMNWHLDISSGKSFPNSFSKDIDIRSDKHGSAKVVWEINRLQFLLPLALKYNHTRNQADLDFFTSVLSNWLDGNPYLQGVNWYSNIEVNIRLIVWYYCWQVLFQIPEVKANASFIEFAEKKWLPSIYEHSFYSYHNPSKYSSANNHLISEHSGLFVACNLWPFKESAKWMAHAKAGLEQEIILQHSANGVNKEEAAEYIQFITDFFLIPHAVAEENGSPFSKTYQESLYKIINYIYHLLDERGGYCKYGDEDDGKVLITNPDPHFNNFYSILTSGSIIFNNPSFKLPDNLAFDTKNQLLFGNKGKAKFDQLATSTTARKSLLLKDEGHFIFRKPLADNGEIYLYYDVAPLGFLSIAAHGHADALSFALHVDGFPFLVDPGTYTYHTDREWRKYFVSTKAHNTICIDNTDQAYLAGPTMWLKHYQTKVLNVVENNDYELVQGTHNGYNSKNCKHERTIKFDKTADIFEITDQLTAGSAPLNTSISFALHPSVSVEKLADNQWKLTRPGCKRSVRLTSDERFNFLINNGLESPIRGWFSPSFLAKQPAPLIVGECEVSGTTIFISKLEII